jgi:hypothetical protein
MNLSINIVDGFISIFGPFPMDVTISNLTITDSFFGMRHIVELEIPNSCPLSISNLNVRNISFSTGSNIIYAANLNKLHFNDSVFEQVGDVNNKIIQIVS